jgi:predicted RNA binding protein with dsRBD fold (UPF0201 family)
MKGFHIDEGWIMIILLSCLVVAFSLVTIGLGLVNVAEAKTVSTPPPTPPPPPPPAPPVPPAAPNRELDQKKTELRVREEQLRRLRQQLEEALRRQQELNTLLAQLERERQDLAAKIGAQDQAAASDRSKVISQEQLRARLEAQIRELERQKKELEQKIAELEEELKRRLSGVVDPADLFSANASGRNPQWIECVQDGVVLLPQRQKVATEAVKKKDRALVQALRRGFTVFLIRPQGFESFRAARAVAEELGIEIGFEPYDAAWKLPQEAGRK